MAVTRPINCNLKFRRDSKKIIKFPCPYGNQRLFKLSSEAQQKHKISKSVIACVKYLFRKLHGHAMQATVLMHQWPTRCGYNPMVREAVRQAF